MTKKTQLLFGAILILIGLSFLPFFIDPFHQKTEGVCFWEWVAKEIYELVHGEIPT